MENLATLPNILLGIYYLVYGIPKAVIGINAGVKHIQNGQHSEGVSGIMGAALMFVSPAIVVFFIQKLMGSSFSIKPDLSPSMIMFYLGL